MKINCAALPPTLIESELFGHERGAFTGALARKIGRFELADGGTIFLDEIGDLGPELQTKLLRVLQEGEFERVGSTRTIKVDVRVIAATHQDLVQAMEAGRFRADLYYRLSVFPIQIPPLRDRREDIPHLVWHFVGRFQEEMGRTIDRIPASVMEALTNYSWPGNVRELQNVIERAVVMTRGRTLQLDEPFLAGRRPTPSAGSDRLEEIERHHILRVLEACGWRIKGPGNAADRLGLHPSTLRHRMNKLGIRRAERAETARP